MYFFFALLIYTLAFLTLQVPRIPKWKWLFQRAYHLSLLNFNHWWFRFRICCIYKTCGT